MKVLLISTYELGRQPFGLASPAAWLRRAGATVNCLDLSREPLDVELVRSARLIAFHVPMHTATRLAVEVLPKVRRLNQEAHLCFYGLYAPVNEAYLRSLGGEIILGGEFEAGLVAAYKRLHEDGDAKAGGDSAGQYSRPEGRRYIQQEPVISLARQKFLRPDRDALPSLRSYARLLLPSGETRTVGYTEASRGCKHLCRHCPIVPVYNGQFRIVRPEVVLEDIRQQVAVGAEHITFGDADFFNGPRHALELVRAMHQEFPGLTYDVTIKIEHLLKQAQHLRTLRDTGCLFVTSAVESVDNTVLARLEKGHTYEDFASVAELLRETGLTLSPTFVAFTPWTTPQVYCSLLERIQELGLVENVAPIQLAIRLLIPAGSRLLELAEIREMVGPFDEAALVYPWVHRDPRVEELCAKVQMVVRAGEKDGESRSEVFRRVWRLAHEVAAVEPSELPDDRNRVARAAIPFLTEPWYC